MITKLIPLSKGLFAIVDADSYDLLSQFTWSADQNGYAVRHELKSEYGDGKRKMVKMHRFIMDAPAEKYVDHINGNTLDNRKSNLRLATNAQNQANAKKWKTNSSGYRGVHKCNQNKNFKISKPWAASIVVNGKRIFKGMFVTKEEAALEYNRLAKKYFGEFARVNVCQ